MDGLSRGAKGNRDVSLVRLPSGDREAITVLEELGMRNSGLCTCGDAACTRIFSGVSKGRAILE
jgi:hypothetical protein